MELPLTTSSTTAAAERAVASRRTAPSLHDATTYDEWKAAALAHDRRTGAEQWRRTDFSRRYDWRIIRLRHDELVSLRSSGDAQALLYYLNEGIHGNMGGMGRPQLYTRARFGTKDLITAYIREQALALETVADAPEHEIPFAEKLEFFRRASHCFGRSALMLSGGGALGPFHLGVVKALLEQDLLPSVISGSSAGSFVAAVLGTHPREQVMDRIQPGHLSSAWEEFEEGERDVAVGNRQMGIDEVRHAIARLIPDITFQEAFELTGLRINVSISPAEPHQSSRLMNAVTSPNVFVRDAVQASCAIPGIFPPVTLTAKDVHGRRRPYVPSRKWVDGSVTDDLPAKRLARLYGVNHFITSMTNPIVLWAVRDADFDDSLPGRLWDIWQGASKQWLKATYPIVMRATERLYPLNLYTRMAYSIATQDYTADINIIPRQRFWDPRKLLAKLSEEETARLVREGELATWPKVEMIRNCTTVGRTLERILDTLEQEYLRRGPGHHLASV